MSFWANVAFDDHLINERGWNEENPNIIDDAEDITNKLHSPYALLLTPAQREKRIFTECTGVVPAKHLPKIRSELFLLL